MSELGATIRQRALCRRLWKFPDICKKILNLSKSSKFVEFPKYDEKCTTDPSWGVNPTALYDCGNPANGYLKFAVNKDFKKNHPKGYKVIKQINFSGPDIDKMAYYMDTEGLEVKAAAQKWLAEHKSKWSKWVKN